MGKYFRLTFTTVLTINDCSACQIAKFNVTKCEVSIIIILWQLTDLVEWLVPPVWHPQASFVPWLRGNLTRISVVDFLVKSRNISLSNQFETAIYILNRVLFLLPVMIFNIDILSNGWYNWLMIILTRAKIMYAFSSALDFKTTNTSFYDICA